MIVMNMIGSEPIAKLVIFRLIQPMASNLISPQRLRRHQGAVIVGRADAS